MTAYQCPNCFGTNFVGFDDSSGIECKTCGCFIPDDMLTKIVIQEAKTESLKHSLECNKEGIQNRDKTIANLHKVIEKQRLKIQRQAETITILSHLYTSGKRCKAHKRLREKYRLLKASFTEWKAMG